MSSVTPAPRLPFVTMSAVSFTAGSAFATAAEHSHTFRNAWSFSASPTPTALCADSPISASAAARPVALFTPDGSTITAPLLKITCSSRPRSRMVSRTVFSCGSTVATMTCPVDSGTPRGAASSANAGGGASTRTRVSFVPGL